MTTMEKMQQELAISQAIDKTMNENLRQMQKLLDDSRIWDGNMEVSQIQNLLSVAQETGSVEVVKNYIRYQIGRDGRSDSWRRRIGTGPTFGDQIIGELDRLQKIAATIAPADAGDEARDRTWMLLARRYLGYLRWYFYYKKRSKEGK